MNFRQLTIYHRKTPTTIKFNTFHTHKLASMGLDRQIILA